MRAHDIQEFAKRDWLRVQWTKLDHWRQQFRAQGWGPAVRAAGALRAQVLAFASRDLDKHRRADLDHHIHVKRLIDAAKLRFTG